MPYYLVKDFVRGLDVRRLHETQEAGALIRADNCVITRGGEIERRKGFGIVANLNAITPDSRGLYVKDEDVWDKYTVFIDQEAQKNMAPDWQEQATSRQVRVIVLPHPDKSARLQRICSVRLIRNKLFISAEWDVETGRYLSYYGTTDSNIAMQVTEDIVIDQTTTGEDGEVADEAAWPSIGNGRAHTSFTLNVLKPQEKDEDGTLVQRKVSLYATNFSTVYVNSNAVTANSMLVFNDFADGDTSEEVAVSIAKGINAIEDHPFVAKADGAMLYVSAKLQGEKYNGWTVYMNAGTPPWIVMAPTSSVMAGGIDNRPERDFRSGKIDGASATFPPTPVGLIPSENSIEIIWEGRGYSDEDEIFVHYSTSTGVYTNVVATGRPPRMGRYNLTGLEPNTLYYIGLSVGGAIMPATPNPYYSARTGIVDVIPDAPDVISAKAADGEIVVEITEVEDATGYIFYAEDKSSNGEVILEVRSTSTTATITGIQSGVYYDVYAKAEGTGGISDRGKIEPNVFYISEEAAVPGQIDNLTASWDDDTVSITLKWDAADANGAPVSYLIASNASSETWETSGLQLVITDPVVTNQAELNGEGVDFTVTPSNEVGDGPSSTVNLPQQNADRDYTSRGDYKYFNPAKYALQVDQKVYGVADDRWTQSFDDNGDPVVDENGEFVISRQESSLLNVSAINLPSEWSPDADGAGFIDFSFYGGDSSNLQSLAQFGNRLAVFAKKSVYIWNVDPDLARSNLSSVVDNTGTFAPRSVVSWGNRDVFYLDLTGIRSLNSREVTGAAFSSDIGTPIDQVVQESVATCFDERYITATMEPLDGRYTIAIPQKSGGTDMFCFTYFASSKISAWTKWSVSRRVEVLTSNSNAMYIRTADNLIMEYGANEGEHYCEVQLPYLSAGKPATMKDIYSIDIAAKGDWSIDYSVTPDMDTPIFEKVGMVSGTSFRQQRIAIQNYAPQISFRLKSKSAGAKLGNLAWHYRDGEETG